MSKKMSLYLWIGGVNLFISSFTFGGGYVVVPMIKKYFVTGKHLFTEEDLIEMAAIAQSSPGAIAINLAILAGKKAAGLPGLLISAVSSLLPPLVILSIISRGYELFASNALINAALKGMQACVAALIVDLIIDMYTLLKKEQSTLLQLLVPVAFIANFFFQINVFFILLFSGILCLAELFLKNRQEKEHTE